MPRINMEDSLFCDDRFMRLVEIMGDRASALGSLVLAFKLAQKHWIPNKQLIPKDEFGMIPNWGHIINCNLAKESDIGFYVKGTESCTEWWFNAQAKGRKGGAASAKARSTTGSPQVNLAQPSSSSSSSNTIIATKVVTNENPKQVGRILEQGEVERFTENLRASLEIEKKPVSRGLVVQYLRTFDAPKDAEDHIEGIFGSAVSKAESVDGQVKYIQASMASHVKQEAQHGN